jgi:hypothetical protein
MTPTAAMAKRRMRRRWAVAVLPMPTLEALLHCRLQY